MNKPNDQYELPQEPYEPPAVEELNTELGPIETAPGTAGSTRDVDAPPPS